MTEQLCSLRLHQECQECHKRILTDFLTTGLAEDIVGEHANAHVKLVNGQAVLDDAVYLPTGLVLGMPVPPPLQYGAE